MEQNIGSYLHGLSRSEVALLNIIDEYLQDRKSASVKTSKKVGF